MRRGHVSIIVGGSRGIGQALARALAARGGSVFVIGRNIQRINDTVKDLGSLGSGKHIGRALDASAPDDMTEMVAVCAENYGRIDLLVFSAIASAEDNASQLPLQVLDLPIAAWRKALDVNLHGAFLANQAVLPLMIRQGGGDILNVGSALTTARHARPSACGRLCGDEIRACGLHAFSGIGGQRARRAGQCRFSWSGQNAAD